MSLKALRILVVLLLIWGVVGVILVPTLIVLDWRLGSQHPVVITVVKFLIVWFVSAILVIQIGAYIPKWILEVCEDERISWRRYARCDGMLGIVSVLWQRKD